MHIVKAHETITSIAAEYGMRPAAVLAANPQTNPRRLRVGQSLVFALNEMRYRIFFAAIAGFWLVMNFLLWRSQSGAHSQIGSAVPVEVVWGQNPDRAGQFLA